AADATRPERRARSGLATPGGRRAHHAHGAGGSVLVIARPGGLLGPLRAHLAKVPRAESALASVAVLSARGQGRGPALRLRHLHAAIPHPGPVGAGAHAQEARPRQATRVTVCMVHPRARRRWALAK